MEVEVSLVFNFVIHKKRSVCAVHFAQFCAGVGCCKAAGFPCVQICHADRIPHVTEACDRRYQQRDNRQCLRLHALTTDGSSPTAHHKRSTETAVTRRPVSSQGPSLADHPADVNTQNSPTKQKLCTQHASV